MAHQLEMVDGKASMFAVGETPWHGLGTVLTTPPATAAEAIKVAGLDWDVEKRLVFTSTGKFLRATPAERAKLTGKDRGVVIPNQFSVSRVTDDKPLGIVGKDYVVWNNREMFAFMDPFLADGSVTFETAGSLLGGTIVWVQARLKETFEVVPGDGVKNFVLLVSSHDGSRKIRARYTPVRVVCANTEAQANVGGAKSAQGRADSVIEIAHKSGVAQNAEAAAKQLKGVYEAAKATQAIFQKLAKRRMAPLEFAELAKALVPDNDEAARHTRTDNIRGELARLFVEGKGQRIRGVPETRWAALNAVSEYVDHVRGIPKNLKMDLERAETRLTSIWFGTGLKLKERALDLLADGVS